MDHERNLELESREIGHKETTTKDHNEVSDTGHGDYIFSQDKSRVGEMMTLEMMMIDER